MLNQKLQLRDTGEYGHGVFAACDISKGETVHIFAGREFKIQEIGEIVKSGALCIDDPLQIDDELFLLLDGTSRAFNHGCNPNAGMRGKGELFALRNIKAGEQVTYDYSVVVGTNITSEMWTMECKCGAENCRKIIGNVLTISEETFRIHKEAGAFLDFIKRQLNLMPT